MVTTYMGLLEYFQKCIPKAKKEGYLFIISLIARYSDAQELYDQLEKDWASLNDLTNNKILFVFSTPKFRDDASFYHKPNAENYVGYICPFVVELKSNGKRVEDNHGRHDSIDKIDWKERHSQAITEFARNYKILEKNIPCLFFYDLVRDKYKTVMVDENENIYAFIKKVVIWIAEYESCVQKYIPIQKYFDLRKKLESLASDNKSKQSIAIGQVLQEKRTYKEVKDNITDPSIKKDLKRLGQWRNHSIFPFGNGLSEHDTYMQWKREEANIEEVFTLQWNSLENLKNKKPEENFETKFVEDLLLACVQLQQGIGSRLKSENERNDYLRDALVMAKYTVLDQSRRGKSATGKSAGEVDLLIQKDGFPITIVEALNLRSLDTVYLDEHLDRIFGYDAIGNQFNVVLAYVNVADFDAFCRNYANHIQEYSYLYSLKTVEDNLKINGLMYTDIRVIKTVHDRNGADSVLYHVCVLFKEK